MLELSLVYLHLHRCSILTSTYPRLFKIPRPRLLSSKYNGRDLALQASSSGRAGFGASAALLFSPEFLWNESVLPPASPGSVANGSSRARLGSGCELCLSSSGRGTQSFHPLGATTDAPGWGTSLSKSRRRVKPRARPSSQHREKFVGFQGSFRDQSFSKDGPRVRLQSAGFGGGELLQPVAGPAILHDFEAQVEGSPR